MKVLAVIGLFVLALGFLLVPLYLLLDRGWGLRTGSWYWYLWATLAVCTGHLALTVALH